jgi:hypothetical protein
MGSDVTELTSSGGKVKNWKVGPEDNDREPYKTRKTENTIFQFELAY